MCGSERIRVYVRRENNKKKKKTGICDMITQFRYF